MNKLIILFFTILSSAAFAQKDSPNISYSMPSVEAGIRWSSADAPAGSSAKQALGIQLGASTVFNFAPSFGLKTGLFYVERPFLFDTSGAESKGKITYFDIPAFFMFKFEEYAGVYFGPSLSFKLGDESTPKALSGIKGTVIPLTLGAQFKFTSTFGLNVFFETLSGDSATGLSNNRAVGASLMIAFD
ncbi:MAG: outer membrane beta-barrel protein [Bdellovibrionaceae bacterium]|nr:outer membrane beta-barrel protein [Bdellovibrio sp.]